MVFPFSKSLILATFRKITFTKLRIIGNFFFALLLELRQLRFAFFPAHLFFRL
jgi:hypothetical protein